MFNASIRITVLAITVFLCAGARAGGITEPPYPFIVVTPPVPAADQDAVVIQVMRGVAVNQYKAPSYEYPAVPFSIEISPLTIYPPIYTVKVQYKEIPVPPNKVVPDIYNPVEYGPVFKLGALKLGRYTVIDSGKTVGSFDVIKSGTVVSYSIKGKVYDDPYPLKIASRPIPGVRVIVKKRVSAPVVTDPPVSSVSEVPVCTTETGTSGEFFVSQLVRGFYRLYCTHPDFNNVSPGIDLSADTAVYITMVAKTAAAAVAGKVSEISSSSVSGLAGTPVEGCTVLVERPAIYFGGGITPGLEPGLSPVTLKAVTDKNGAYLIPKIPIAYNGEKWLVKALKTGYGVESRYVALYNLKTDSVDFRLESPFTNTHSDTIDGIIFTMAANKSLYAVGEGLIARYSIFNATAAPVKFFPFEKNCVYDMTVADQTGKILFRLSDIIGGITPSAPVEMTVKPGETVAETFPTYYIPKLAPALFNKQPAIVLTIAGRLRGTKYDATEVSVPVKVLAPITQMQPAQSEPHAAPGVTCSPIRDRVAVTVSHSRNVSFTVYALDGKIRHDLSFKKVLTAGTHVFAFDSGTTPSSVYIVKIATDGYSKAFKVCTEGK